MSNAVYFNSYKLKKGASIPDFLFAVENLFNEIKSTHKGVISLTLLVDGERWADYIVFETMDDLNAFIKSAKTAQENGTNDLAEKFYAFLDWDNDARSHHFSVKGNYLPGR